MRFLAHVASHHWHIPTPLNAIINQLTIRACSKGWPFSDPERSRETILCQTRLISFRRLLRNRLSEVDRRLGACRVALSCALQVLDATDATTLDDRSTDMGSLFVSDLIANATAAEEQQAATSSLWLGRQSFGRRRSKSSSL